MEAHKLEGLLFLGDLNARNTNWNSTVNPHGVVLDEKLDSSVKVLHKGEPTFLACNGNSVIDLCQISGKITNQTFTLNTDEDVELFTGAPNRGHIPVTFICSRPSTTFRSQRKPWIDEAKWEKWREVIESKLGFIQEVDPTALWLKLVKIVREATDSSIPFKTTNKHSKLFWNDELTIASNNLRYLRKKFTYHSNPSNGAKLDTAREYFKMLLSEHSSKWLSDTLMELGNKQVIDFWRAYNRFFKRKAGTFDPIKYGNEKYLCSPKEIAGEFRKTSFEARHLQQETFSRVHEVHVTAAVASSSFFVTTENDPIERLLQMRTCSRSKKLLLLLFFRHRSDTS